MNSLNKLKINVILVLFLSISFWNCSKNNDCEEVKLPDINYPFGGKYYINWPINIYINNYNDSIRYEWSCEPKESATIEIIDSLNTKITPNKTGDIKISITAIKNNCYSEPLNIDYFIQSNRLSKFENTIWKGNMKIYNNYVLTSSGDHTVIIEYINEDKLYIKGEYDYYYGVENKSDSKILNYQKGSGPSSKNGMPKYKLDLTKKTLEFDHCTYYGTTVCHKGSYKMN